MKHLLIGLFLYMSVSVSAQEMQVMPEKPSAGETITLSYNPGDGPLKDMEAHAIVYSFVTGEEPVAYEVALDNSKGTFKVPKNSQALFIKFSNADESVIDKNNEKGYPVLLYKGGKSIKGSNSALASAYLKYHRYIYIDQGADLGKQHLNAEYEAYPNQKSDDDCFALGATLARSLEDEVGIKNVQDKIQGLLGNAATDEEQLMKAVSWSTAIGNKDLNAEIRKVLLEKFPDGEMALNSEINALRDLEDVDKKVAEYNRLVAKIGTNEKYAASLNSMARLIAIDYGSEGDREKFFEYANKIDSPTMFASLCNSLAWGFTGESLEGEPQHLKFGEEISRLSLSKVDSERTQKTQKPSYFSDTRWQNNMDYSYAMYSDTYALLAHKLGDKAGALKYQTIAVKENDFEDGDMNTRYAIFKEAQDGGESVMPFLEKMIQEGNASIKMKDQYLRLYKQHITIDQAADKYVALLEEKAKEKHKEEVKKEIIEEEGKPFSLVNLEGETVSLDAMKGKIVILDFWATWCGPCKASFPGMQMAVDKYADDAEVEFLFVDTWESGDNKEEIVSSFIEKNAYRFNVLMDNKNEVVANYGVRGIPTKFILDGDGNIRYKSVGFSGNDAELVDELSIVIDILKEESGDMVQP